MGQQKVWLPLGVLALLAGVSVVLSATRGSTVAEPEPAREAQWDVAAVPSLGEMLVSLRLVSRHDLEKALARQRGSQKRLGQILVEMRVITHAQLAEVLEEQLDRRLGRFRWRWAARWL